MACAESAVPTEYELTPLSNLFIVWRLGQTQTDATLCTLRSLLTQPNMNESKSMSIAKSCYPTEPKLMALSKLMALYNHCLFW